MFLKKYIRNLVTLDFYIRFLVTKIYQILLE